MSYGEYVGAARAIYHCSDSTDSSPNGYTLTTSTGSVVAGKFGNCFSFASASTQYASVNTNCGLTAQDVVTASCWVKPAADPANGVFMAAWSMWDLTNKAAYRIYYGLSGGVYYIIADAIGAGGAWKSATPSSTKLSTTAFTNLIQTVGSGVNKLYINGIFAAQIAVSGDPSPYTHANTMSIGAWNAYNTDTRSLPWNGLIDEVVVVNGTWTAAQVKQYYNMTKGRFNPQFGV